jgi:HPt (histidine-containing phosphotransfer) domain-containing protein
VSKLGEPSIHALIEAARLDFATSLPVKVGALDAQVQTEAWEDVRRGAHNLRGSAGVHGFTAISDFAAAVEELLVASRGAPEAEARERVRALLDGLRDEVAKVGREAT